MKSKYFWVMEIERTAVIKLCNVNMTDDLKQALLGFHVFTDNDYVLSFFTEGKAGFWNIVKNARFIKRFQEFDLPWEIPLRII